MRDISKEAIIKAFKEKGLCPRKGSYNLRIDWSAEGGPEFVAQKHCCAISALVHGEKLSAVAAAALRRTRRPAGRHAAARVHLGLGVETRDELVKTFDENPLFFDDIKSAVGCSDE
jgi:hypothetical protein